MGASRHILALMHPGTNSRDIFADCVAGFEAAGHGVLRLDLGTIWQASARLDGQRDLQGLIKGDFTQMLMDVVRANRIDLAIGMWANVPLTFINPMLDGRAGTVFDALGVPLAWWWLDAPHWAHGGAFVQHLRSEITRGASAHHIINNFGTAREMRECFAMGRVHAIGYGVDGATFAGGEGVGADHDVVMCLGPGDAVPTEAIVKAVQAKDLDWRGVRQGVARELESQVMVGFAGETSVRDLIVELLRSQVGGRHEPMLSRAEALAAGSTTLRQGLEVLVRNPALYIKATDLVRSVERYERGAHAARLAQRFRFAAFGPGVAEWAKCWNVAERVTDLGTVGKCEQGAAYRRGRVGVNVMRWQDDVGINIKPLEITASGVACVCGQRSGLGDLFTLGTEIVDAETPDEMAARVGDLLDDDARRGRIAHAGRQRTMRDHTWKARSREWIEAIFGSEN